MFYKMSGGLERTRLITPSRASTSPLQMNARRGAACYVLVGLHDNR